MNRMIPTGRLATPNVYFFKKSLIYPSASSSVEKCPLLAGGGSLGRDSDPNNHTREHVTPQTGEEKAAHSPVRRPSLPGIQGWSRVGRNREKGKEWTDISTASFPGKTIAFVQSRLRAVWEALDLGAGAG